MKLIAYGLTDVLPTIRPASSTRPWLDKLPQAFAYRCLPLNIACSHGWEILCPVGFEASWNGKDTNDGIWVRLDRDHPWKPQAHFGHGILTFHPHHLFRTEPGYSTYVTGPTNQRKHGMVPLTGVIETDWSPYTFTMNWAFTAAGSVRFEEGEPFCMFFPVQRGLLETIVPERRDLASDPETKKNYEVWKESRDTFNLDLHNRKPEAVQEKWQKTYYRGILPTGAEGTPNHQIKLQLKPFTMAIAVHDTPGASQPAHSAARRDDAPKASGAATSNEDGRPPSSNVTSEAVIHAIQTMAQDLVTGGDPAEHLPHLASLGVPEPELRRLVESARANPLVQAGRSATMRARKREWLLHVIEGHRRLSPASNHIESKTGLRADEFFERHYALHRPVILLGEIADWPALSKWTPEYLRDLIGPRVVAYRDGRHAVPRGAGRQVPGSGEMPFDRLIDTLRRPGADNGAYLVALDPPETVRDAEALPLLRDLGSLDEFLVSDGQSANGLARFGSASTLTSLHHDLANNFIVQLAGRTRMKIVPAADVPRIYNSSANYSDVSDLDSLDLARYPLLRELKVYDVTLNPGEILFLPLGWWRQTQWPDFGVAIEYTNFRWPNDWDGGFPAE